MSSKKETTLAIIGGVMSLTTMLSANTHFDSTQKIEKATMQQTMVSAKDEMGTFGMCGMGMGCSGGGGQCGMGMGCGGQ